VLASRHYLYLMLRHSMPAVRCVLLFASVLVLSGGCASHPTRPPRPEMPGVFDQGPRTQTVIWPSADWYRGFDSGELDMLIEQAQRDNLDIAKAAARVRQADARARQAHAGILPSVDLTGSPTYMAGHAFSNGSGHEFDWSALLSATYEIDFWGKNRAALDSARASGVASAADRDTVAITTLAGIANTYFDVLSLRGRLGLERSNVDAAQALDDIVEARFREGLASPAEVAAQRAVLAGVQLAIPDLEQLEQEARSALALLVGRAPEGFDLRGQGLDGLQEPAVAPGLPSELLLRRPDVLSAEANLAAASADVVAARAAMFPALALTANGGLANPALNAAVDVISGVGPTASLAASFTQPIFNRGRLRAARDEAQAKELELTLDYRSTILSALVDVENALSAIQRLDEARDAQHENVLQTQRAFDAAQARFKAGNVDYLSVLDAQRGLFQARDQLGQYQLARLQALVGLCKALGGGWQVPHDAQSVTAAHGS
jgi:outer membrane protein, multidrug efflux system